MPYGYDPIQAGQQKINILQRGSARMMQHAESLGENIGQIVQGVQKEKTRQEQEGRLYQQALQTRKGYINLLRAMKENHPGQYEQAMRSRGVNAMNLEGSVPLPPQDDVGSLQTYTQNMNDVLNDAAAQLMSAGWSTEYLSDILGLLPPGAREARAGVRAGLGAAGGRARTEEERQRKEREAQELTRTQLTTVPPGPISRVGAARAAVEGGEYRPLTPAAKDVIGAVPQPKEKAEPTELEWLRYLETKERGATVRYKGQQDQLNKVQDDIDKQHKTLASLKKDLSTAQTAEKEGDTMALQKTGSSESLQAQILTLQDEISQNKSKRTTINKTLETMQREGESALARAAGAARQETEKQLQDKAEALLSEKSNKGITFAEEYRLGSVSDYPLLRAHAADKGIDASVVRKAIELLKARQAEAPAPAAQPIGAVAGDTTVVGGTRNNPINPLKPDGQMDPAAYARIPSGAYFRHPDGSVRQKP